MISCQNTEEGNASECLNPHIPCFHPLLQLRSARLSERARCVFDSAQRAGMRALKRKQNQQCHVKVTGF